MLKIDVQYTTDHNDVPSEAQIQEWIRTTLQHTPVAIPTAQRSITICFISREKSAALNQQFRQKSGPTNVLAFEDEPLGPLPADSLGDLAICADVVHEEAQALACSTEAHFAHMVIHGLLHLLGYDHITNDDATIMEPIETQILQSLGFDDPYQ